jgi:hypothetical protein
VAPVRERRPQDQSGDEHVDDCSRRQEDDPDTVQLARLLRGVARDRGAACERERQRRGERGGVRGEPHVQKSSGFGRRPRSSYPLGPRLTEPDAG